MNMAIPDLAEAARRTRISILRTVHHAGCGHTGGSLSAVEILTALYFRLMRLDPARPAWPDRDRFILSKGHATPCYYATLAARGFFPEKELEGFDCLGSILQGHPDMRKTPGVDMSAGSLGQGLSCGIGMALGAAVSGHDINVYVLLGDGECQEGQVWEAALYAGDHRVKRLIAIVDYNGVQLSSRTDEATSLEPFAEKWRAFKWETFTSDGHDMADLVPCLEKAREAGERGPVVVIARTIKGKGVSFMEGKYQWHAKAPNDEEFAIAMRELAEVIHEDPCAERSRSR